MKPGDVQVVFNTISHEIKFVTSEEFMAQRALQRFLDLDEITGTTPNSEKLVIVSLGRAIAEIVKFHEDKLADTKECFMLEIDGLKNLNRKLANQL